MSTLGNVLNQIFRPTAFEARRVAAAMEARPEQVRESISRLLTEIKNAGYGISLGNDAFEKRYALKDMSAAERFGKTEAGEVTDACRIIKRDLAAQCKATLKQIGRDPCWYRDKLGTLRVLTAEARRLQHFHGSKAG